MLSKKIKYEDFDGNLVEETYYFNLSESELVKLETTMPGGFAEKLKRCLQNKMIPELMSEFENIILASYGEKSLDGKKFVKNNSIREDFHCSAAFDALFMELLTDSDAAAAFLMGVIPKKLVEKSKSPEVQKQIESLNLPTIG